MPPCSGWITIRMRGQIPLEKDRTYFFVCNEINDGKPWFGAFAFAEGDPYKRGRHWLHPKHDLVFRSYVGKTANSISTNDENSFLLDNKPIPGTEPTKTLDPLPSPLPMSVKSTNSALSTEQKSDFNLTNNPEGSPLITGELNKTLQNSQNVERQKVPSDQNKSKKSLFDRFFKDSK